MKHLSTSILSIFLAFLLLFPANIAVSETWQDILAAMDDKQLLSLFQLLSQELEWRGLIAGADDQTEEILVWVPRSGKKYHDKATCSGMKSPLQVTLQQAKNSGYEPCKKCDPPK